MPVILHCSFRSDNDYFIPFLITFLYKQHIKSKFTINKMLFNHVFTVSVAQIILFLNEMHLNDNPNDSIVYENKNIISNSI